MDLIKRFQAGFAARKLQSPQGLSGEAVAEAQEQLVAMGPAAIGSVLKSLHHGETAAIPALAVLTRLLTNETLTAYIDALRSPVPSVADAAAHALSHSDTYDATQLLPLFSDPVVSKAGLESILSSQLKQLQPATLMRVLPGLSKDARGSVFRLIEKRADSSVVQEAVALASHAEWWLRLHMARLLARFPDPRGTEAIMKLLKDENPAVRLEAVKGLAQLKPTSAIPALCQRLRDSDIKVQGAAIETLISLGDVAAVPHLIEHLKDDSEYVRRGAVEVLNQVVTVDAIKDLVGALRDADWWVRVRSADALGSLGGSRVVDAIISLIDDPDDFVRRYAVEILNTVPDRRAVDALIHALEDSDWWVRERAIDALAKTGDPKSVEPLMRMLGRDPKAIPIVIKALAQIQDARAVEPICRLARSESAEVRREAIHALTQFIQLDMPEESRHDLMETLEAAGVSTERTTALPMEVRSRYGPDSGRVDTAHKRSTPPEGAADVRQDAPAPRALNFQKLEPGSVLIDRFRVLQRIGGGGFGTVYLVEDVIVREEMVLKILSPQLSLDGTMIRRFVQELKLSRRITHPSVIRIYDLLDLNGAHAISMEHFAGRDLGTVIKQEGALPVERVLGIARQIVEGLGAAHGLGIVHRDIKPANILVGDDGTVKIVDFGLASVGQTSRSRLTQSGILVGTPEYISPEQITGHEVDGRTDLYSLGVVIYELLSGQQPFAGSNAVNILFQHLEAEVPPVDTVAAGISPEVNELVMRCMSRFANDRPASASAMLEMLNRLA
ncbi:MAG: HEAT repeat domain-containing protein [Candidatus Eisenbacteria bacterium]